MKKFFYILIFLILFAILFLVLNVYNKNYYCFITYRNYDKNINIIKKKTNIKDIINNYKSYDYIKIDKINSEKSH